MFGRLGVGARVGVVILGEGFSDCRAVVWDGVANVGWGAGPNRELQGWGDWGGGRSWPSGRRGLGSVWGGVRGVWAGG